MLYTLLYVGRVHCRGSVHLFWRSGCLRLRLPLPHIPRIWKGESGHGHRFPLAYIILERWVRSRPPFSLCLYSLESESVTATLFPCFLVPKSESGHRYSFLPLLSQFQKSESGHGYYFSLLSRVWKVSQMRSIYLRSVLRILSGWALKLKSPLPFL